MLNIAVVEDEEQERKNLLECIEYLCKRNSIPYSVTEFSSGAAFLGGYKPVYDIILMDIQMPGMDGMETARALRKIDYAVILVFVTNMAQYAINGYEVDAMNYILKPVNKYDFSMKMTKAISRAVKHMDEAIQVRGANEMYALRVASIKYLEVLEHYVTYHSTEGNFCEYITLKEAEKKINKSFFERCGRSYLVNLKYVTGIQDGEVLIGNESLPISRTYKKTFLKAFAVFVGGV